MSSVQHSSYLRIEDKLDQLGQRMRVRRLLRGALLCLATVTAGTLILGAIAHWTPAASVRLWALLTAWVALVIGAVFVWIVIPLAARFDAVRVARHLESTIGSLHNGLTNSVLLARRGDIENNPYLEPIFDEVEAGLSAGALNNAVKLSDLRRLAIVCCGVMAAGGIVWLAAPGVIGHGVRQLFEPNAFVPRVGAAKLVTVTPGDVTLVAGESLELSAVADTPAGSTANVVFKNGPADATLSGTPEQNLQRYAYRLEHVDASMSYRVDIAGTQSRWYTVDVVKAIGLTSVALTAVPPTYTGVAASTITETPAQLQATPVAFPQGSKLSIAATLDAPVKAALLQSGSAQPTPMETGPAHRTFNSTLTINDETTAAVMATDGSGQILSILPQPPLSIHCTKDLPPTIQLTTPSQDMTVGPTTPLRVRATLHDDYGLTASRILIGFGTDGAMTSRKEWAYPSKTKSIDLDFPLDLPADRRVHGSSFRLQVQAIDNCGLDSGPQTSSSSIVTIQFQDASVLARQELQCDDQLRTLLQALLNEQVRLNGLTLADQPFRVEPMRPIAEGQAQLLDRIKGMADTFTFDASNRIVQKTLQVLVLNSASDAVARSQLLLGKSPPATTFGELVSSQHQIIDVLQSLLARLGPAIAPSTQPSATGNDPLVSKPDTFKAFDDALKQYQAEQRKLLDQLTGLAKKPVDDFSDKDQKLLADLLQQQDKLDAFMQSKVSDFSKLAEQDMSNASMVKDATSIMTEVTMAKDALKQQSMEIAVAAEDGGLESAQSLETNIEKWLSNAPDRQQWTQEELPQHSDTPMPELPAELQDMVGQLIEQQEDLFDQVEDMNANITDSADKGIGWTAMDGPIADMSAKGVTGNVLPNNNEMGGRSGEGRSGRSQGEFVGDSAIGKGGRNTPTRLDPTAFQKGQITDTSKDPTGGATGGGKLSGEGGAGLTGPVPPKLSAEMKRLATKQAEIRNTAERIALQYKVGRYDNFKLDESIAMMRRVQKRPDRQPLPHRVAAARRVDRKPRHQSYCCWPANCTCSRTAHQPPA